MSQEELMQVSRVIDFKMDQPVGEAPPKKIPRPETKKEKPHPQSEQLRLLELLQSRRTPGIRVGAALLRPWNTLHKRSCSL